MRLPDIGDWALHLKHCAQGGGLMSLLAIEWILDGIGTEIVSLLVGMITGGAGGWHLHKSRIRVHQRAGNHATQSVTISGNDEATSGR